MEYFSTLFNIMLGALGILGLLVGGGIFIVGIAATIVEEKARFLLLCPIGFLAGCSGLAWFVTVVKYL